MEMVESLLPLRFKGTTTTYPVKYDKWGMEWIECVQTLSLPHEGRGVVSEDAPPEYIKSK